MRLSSYYSNFNRCFGCCQNFFNGIK